MYWYHPDYVSNVDMVTDRSGEAYELFLYNAWGESLHHWASSSTNSWSSPYRLNSKELDSETGMHYYGARYHHPKLSVWMSVDPLVHLRSWVSPYNFVQNNPINRVDPDGALDAPIYDTEGEFLGTDNEGLQGKAIIMNKSDFKQGMSHDDALSKSKGYKGLSTQGAKDKFTAHYNNLPTRPDYDGYLTLDEANEWYRTGNGQPLFTDLSKIDLSGIYSLGENYVGEKGSYNLLLNSYSLNDGLVYGNITLKRYSDHQVRAYADEYNFEMHNGWNPLNWPRNAETLIGRKYAGEGQKFEINLYGSKKLTPILPWIK